MGRAGARRRVDADAGFSLVELLVIVIILGVLAGIAISTYLSQTRKVERAAAISTLSSMRLAAESIRADAGSEDFSRDPDEYDDEQPAYDYVGALVPSTGSGVVSVGPNGGATGASVAFAVRGKDRCYYLRIETGSDALFRAADDIAGGVDCTADEYGTGADSGWD